MKEKIIELIKYNQFDKCQEYFRDGNNTDICDEKKRTPLHVALCYPKRKKICQYLIQQNAPLNAQTIDGDTPLHYAVRAGNIDIVALLLEKGANDAICNRRAQTPYILAWILTGRDSAMTGLLAEYMNAIPAATHLQVVKKYMALDKRRQQSMLHKAIKAGNIERAKMLLESGHNINQQDHLGRTPYDYYLSNDVNKKMRKQIYAFLEAHGAQPSIVINRFTGYHLKTQKKQGIYHINMFWREQIAEEYAAQGIAMPSINNVESSVVKSAI